MITDNELKTCLEIWKEEQKSKIAFSETIHISDEKISQMVEDDGMKDIDSEDLEHLSRCPICMEKWALWRDAISALEEEDQESAPLMTYGFLRAAATPDDREPISSLSSCGRFKLNIEPPLSAGDRWLVIFETISDTDASFEGRKIQVRDKKGLALLDGTIVQGRMARYWTTIADFDLSDWTIMEKS